jgi:superfamily I DNA/RNA helicase
VGRNLLIDHLQGDESNNSVQKNGLDDLDTFGALAYEDHEIRVLIDELLVNNILKKVPLQHNRNWKVFQVTDKGLHELDNPTLPDKQLSLTEAPDVEITEQDKALFDALGDELARYNKAQKKAIVADDEDILCLAGAGTGKTTVLTKRIDFLTRYRSVDPRDVLAITFTRKARQEMRNRLKGSQVRIETFNSFCEKLLKEHNDLVYDKRYRVASYQQKLTMVRKAIERLNYRVEDAIDTYFTDAQRRSKTDDQLFNIFVNDCFFIRDYLKFKNRPLDRDSFTVDDDHERSFELVLGVCKYIKAYMAKHGLRDYADQLTDTLQLFREHDDLVPSFEHVLVDEYQDVNATQVALLDALDAPNLFCVGDPRQSIYGWRGSDISFIMNFEEAHPDCSVIPLTKNYRSAEPIVRLINQCIRRMGLPDLEAVKDGANDLHLEECASEVEEFAYVADHIKAADVSRDEIFVLTRTNRQLNELSSYLRKRSIKHLKKSDDRRGRNVPREDEITLATVHSIKGMEADMVFVIGANAQNYPCKGSEHPVIEMAKVDEYDKIEEERRLFYVALSRARQTLHLTYTGSSPTRFVTSEMLKTIYG